MLSQPNYYFLPLYKHTSCLIENVINLNSTHTMTVYLIPSTHWTQQCQAQCDLPPTHLGRHILIYQGCVLFRLFLVANLFAGELCGSLHCCRKHPVGQSRLAVQEVQGSLVVLTYHHLLWNLGLPAWTHLEDLRIQVKHNTDAS